MKKYKGIIFDLDGVICHTDEYHYQAWKKLANYLHIPFDREINNQLRGVGRMDSLNIILQNAHILDVNIQTKEKYAKMKNDYYVQLIKNMNQSHLSNDVLATLQKLKQKGYLLAIGSSSKNTKFILNNLGIMDQFDTICDGTNIRYAKPNPEVFLKAAQQLHLLVQECVVVEDAISGIDAAKNGQFNCFGMGDAYQYNQATYHIQNFVDLLEYL